VTDDAASSVAPVEHQLVTCPHCNTEVPVGAFCGNCGAHFATADTTRQRSYAGAPGEHVLHSSVITTLFPHLPRRQAHAFRFAFGIAVAVVFILAAVRWLAPATLVSVLVLPVLYLLYLYESEVYEDEPLLVLGVTFFVAGALGFVYVLIADQLSTPSFGGTQEGPLVSGVLLPVIAQILMVAGPLVLLTRSKFDETLDGLTFGVTAGLGFTMVAVITAAWHIFTAPLQQGVDTYDIIRVLQSGVLAAIVNAGTTGLIAAATWLHVHRPPNRVSAARWLSLPLVVAVGFGVQIVLGIAGYYIPTILGLLVLWLVAAALLLVAVRVVLHFGLMEEAVESEMGPLSACSECSHVVPLMAFCPNCGASRLAMPKHTRHQHREVA